MEEGGASLGSKRIPGGSGAKGRDRDGPGYCRREMTVVPCGQAFCSLVISARTAALEALSLVLTRPGALGGDSLARKYGG